VVGKHLPMVLSWLLRVNNIKLVEPPSELGEVVEFSQGYPAKSVSGERGFGVRSRTTYTGELFTKESS
jgi:hypothetical protein